MGRLDGKVAIITGAGQGLGEAIAAGFAKEGAKVVGTDIVEDRIKDAMGKLAEIYGDSVISKYQDVREKADWERVVAETVEKYGKVDIVVNNAGITSGKAVLDATVEDFLNLYHTDCVSLMLSVQAACPEMEKVGGGSFVTIGSVGSLASGLADGNDAAYCAAKGALRSLNRHCAYHMAPKDIRVNLVMPAVMKTPLTDASVKANPGILDMLEGLYPLNPHMIEISSVVNATIFMASDESCAMTGTEIVLDAGCLTK